MQRRNLVAEGKGYSELSRTVAYLTASLGLVAAIVALAMAWVRNSHTRQVYEGRVVYELWGTHGIHTLDLVVLAVELGLLALLVIVLVAGFSRSR